MLRARIGKAKATLLQLNFWCYTRLPPKIKVIIVSTNVKTVLLYGVEAWRTTTTITEVKVFINKCLLKIHRMHWSETISNKVLRHRMNQLPLEEE